MLAEEFCFPRVGETPGEISLPFTGGVHMIKHDVEYRRYSTSWDAITNNYNLTIYIFNIYLLI
jgi:hypothetical protein